MTDQTQKRGVCIHGGIVNHYKYIKGSFSSCAACYPPSSIPCTENGRGHRKLESLPLE